VSGFPPASGRNADAANTVRHLLDALRGLRETDDLVQLAKDGYAALDELAELEAQNARLRRRIPRCSHATPYGYRCSKGVGHDGMCSHPNDAKKAKLVQRGR